MRSRLLTLAALVACWPAWVASGLAVDLLAPAGTEFLLRCVLCLLALGLLGRAIDGDDGTGTEEGDGGHG
ncbi:hypothetical protein [Falsiroseomonas sp. HW251]|uniref:hypothetical protein n=1 Tax=Falsiroseomonas sp. HW251 TaxID=3390998 RepID=UPI003D31F3AF